MRRFRHSMFLIVMIAVAGTLDWGPWTSSSVAAERPLRVFILAGQSNMQGHADVRTIDGMRHNEAALPLLEKMRSADGVPVELDDVWISSVGSSEMPRVGKLTTGFGANESKIGPEFTFGITVAEQFDGPILIIKTAWGGKSLHTDFRPPGGGPFEFSPAQRERMIERGDDFDQVAAEKKEATGHYYRLMIDHVQNVLMNISDVIPAEHLNDGYELSGFVWFQGWNDMVDASVYPERGQPGGYDSYGRLMAQFIRDVRKDLKTPELPFVIGVLGVGGPTDQYDQGNLRYQAVHQNFRDAMAAPVKLPEFEGNTTAVLTEQFWDHEAADLKKRDAKQLTESELEILRQSVSNQEYHYLGSAAIMAQIGAGFAEAMMELMNRR